MSPVPSYTASWELPLVERCIYISSPFGYWIQVDATLLSHDSSLRRGRHLGWIANLSIPYLPSSLATMRSPHFGRGILTGLVVAATPSFALGPNTGTPVQQAVLSWHSTSPHTPLMTCREGFIPYCCGALVDDPGTPGRSICRDGPGDVTSLGECETPEMIRRGIGGACVQKNDDGRIVIAYGAGKRCWVLIDGGMRSCREGESYGNARMVVELEAS